MGTTFFNILRHKKILFSTGERERGKDRRTEGEISIEREREKRRRRMERRRVRKSEDRGRREGRERERLTFLAFSDTEDFIFDTIQKGTRFVMDMLDSNTKDTTYKSWMATLKRHYARHVPVCFFRTNMRNSSKNKNCSYNRQNMIWVFQFSEF